MDNEEKILDEIGTYTFILIKTLGETKAQLRQKIHMHRQSGLSEDYVEGDVYYHNGLDAIEQLSNQVLGLQAWIKSNISTTQNSKAINPKSAMPNIKAMLVEIKRWASSYCFTYGIRHYCTDPRGYWRNYWSFYNRENLG